jgi:SAM-dependent methyltransferase
MTVREPTDILTKRKKIWSSNKVLRRLYRKWFIAITSALKPGNILELGGGSGNLKEFLPNVISSDVLHVPWLDAVLDAHDLPFKSESLDNIVLFDVLHHLNQPGKLFYEADRVLKTKGRIVLMEPYVSLLSFLVYRFLHTEDLTHRVNPFRMNISEKKADAFQGNQAMANLIFEKHRTDFIKHFPRLHIVYEDRTAFFIYPLTGGFHGPGFCPMFFFNTLEHAERLLKPLDRYLAFRLFLVIEKEGMGP